MSGALLRIGKVARPRGLRGHFFLDLPIGKILPPGTVIRMDGRDYVLESQTETDRTVLKVQGIDTPEALDALRNVDVFVPRESLGQGLLLSDLIGCEVVDRTSGKLLGKVKDWHENPAHDLLELENGALIPLVDEFFPDLNPASRRLEATLPEGLLDL